MKRMLLNLLMVTNVFSGLVAMRYCSRGLPDTCAFLGENYPNVVVKKIVIENIQTIPDRELLKALVLKKEDLLKKFLLKRYPVRNIVFNSCWDNGDIGERWPLWEMVVKHQVRFVQLLIEAGYDVHITPPVYATLLFATTNFEITKILLNHGVNSRVQNYRQDDAFYNNLIFLEKTEDGFSWAKLLMMATYRTPGEIADLLEKLRKKFSGDDEIQEKEILEKLIKFNNQCILERKLFCNRENLFDFNFIYK